MPIHRYQPPPPPDDEELSGVDAATILLAKPLAAAGAKLDIDE
jgi:hypothetical protein